MLSEQTAAYWWRARWFEGASLLIAAPFLLFPTFFWPGTLLAMLLVAAIWLAPLFLVRKPLPPPTPFHAILLLFCLMLIVGILVTADPDLTLPKATNLLLGLTLWRTLTLAGHAEQPSLLHRATALFLLAGLGVAAFGILNADWLAKASSQVTFLQNIVTRLPWETIALAGARSGIHPNQVAGAILLFLPLLVSLWLGWQSPHANQRLIRLALAAGTLLAAVALLFSQSRSGWIGGLGGLLVLLLLWILILPPSRIRRLLLGLGIAVVLFGLVFAVLIGPQRLLGFWEEPQAETAVGSLATFSYRQAIWPWAITAAGDFAFTGTGLGTFRRVVGRLYPIGVAQDGDLGHAHNVLLQAALDLGLPGLVTYLALLFVAAALCWRAATRDVEIRPFALGYLASLVAFHIYGLTDAVALGAKPGFLFWWLLGLITCLPPTARFVGNSRPAVLS